MESNNGGVTIGHLRDTLSQQIMGQELLKKRYSKILRRLAFIIVGLTIVILGGIFFIAYTLRQPHSVLTETLEAKKDIDTRMRLHSDFINMNTDSISKNSDMINKSLIKIDSLEKLLRSHE